MQSFSYSDSGRVRLLLCIFPMQHTAPLGELQRTAVIWFIDALSFIGDPPISSVIVRKSMPFVNDMECLDIYMGDNNLFRILLTY